MPLVQMYQHDLFSSVKEEEVYQIHHLILVWQERFLMDDEEIENNVDTEKKNKREKKGKGKGERGKGKGKKEKGKRI